MDVDTLLENFETLAEAPSGIDLLKDLCLDLALRGKFNTCDLPSEDLSKTHSCSGIDLGIPNHWGTVSFSENFDMKGGGQPPKSTFVDSPQPGYIRLYQIRDYGPNPVPVYIPSRIAPKTTKKGDILLARYGASGKVFWAEEGAYNVALAKLIFPESLYLKPFAFLLFKSNWFQETIRNTTRVAVDGFNKNDLKNIHFPLPPLGEQQQIITKVHELMALCDGLEQQQKLRDNLRIATRRSAIDAISTATTPEELEAAWKRINSNWEVIADTPESIESLRELILRMAAKGFFIDPSLSQHEVKKFIILNTKSANKPKLRSFFNSRGKIVYEIQIADAADLVPQAQSKIKTNQIKQSGKHPVVDQGQQFISGFIDDVAPISASDKAVLVFGDHTRNIKFIDFDFVVGSDGVKVLCAKFLEPKFFYYMARSIKLPSRGYGRHYKAFCSNYIPIFSQSEQMMTVSTFENLMSLCDQLEIELKLRSEASEKFARSVLSAA